MTVTVLHNSTRKAVVHVASASGTIVIAGDSSQSNIALANQNLTGATISKIWYGSAGGSWNVKRDTTLVYTASGSGFHFFDGAPLSIATIANVVCEIVGSTNGFIMLELHKQGDLGI